MRTWLLAWFGGVVIGVVNGIVREKVYARRVGEATAHRVSSATAIAAFAGWFCILQRRAPLRSLHQALGVGLAWVVMTVGFEFGFGRLVARQSWRGLLADYDLRRGRLWPLVLAWIGIGPAVTRTMRRRQVGARSGKCSK